MGWAVQGRWEVQEERGLLHRARNGVKGRGQCRRGPRTAWNGQRNPRSEPCVLIRAGRAGQGAGTHDLGGSRACSLPEGHMLGWGVSQHQEGETHGPECMGGTRWHKHSQYPAPFTSDLSLHVSHREPSRVLTTDIHCTPHWPGIGTVIPDAHLHPWHYPSASPPSLYNLTTDHHLLPWG